MNNIEHLGVIIDGNRRYAKKVGIPMEEAYRLGAQKVYETIKFVLGETEVNELSIYALSYDNLLRGDEELRPILGIQTEEFDKWSNDPFFTEKGIQVRFLGEIDKLPQYARESCMRLQEKTAGNNKKTLNILMAYTGHREINVAIKRIVEKLKGMNHDADMEKLIEENLETTRPVNVIIRTAGENRLSGFLPLEAEYAELYSVNKMWPEITTDEIRLILKDYEEKEVKHGL